ncbi:hypothetical protein FANTH_11690 [Fusarium anthophilum]|uniref:Uncharacterized protein n=1 Tax=Fusarium anthophilum TaxID=48485 RepID=A0A8H4YVU9_9HYPO|nr:hypothetical protein FANTH_11690 [Fusarium anthophilum]
MFSPQTILSALAIASMAISAQAIPTSDSTQELAAALGVTIADIEVLETTTDTSKINAKIWTNPLGLGQVDISAWDDEIKKNFLDEIKDSIKEAYENAPKHVKRITGSQSPAARAQVQSAVANARAQRDSSNRRKILQCNSGTQKACTLCASICSAAWVSGSAICGGAALGAEAASAGTLTPAVALTLGGCLGLATSAYAACIVKCVG